MRIDIDEDSRQKLVHLAAMVSNFTEEFVALELAELVLMIFDDLPEEATADD